MTLRKFIGKLHLWLGLSSGLVVFIIAITGCIYAFQDEIKNLIQPYRFVERQQRPFLPPSGLKLIAEQALPKKHVHAIMYQGAANAAKVIFYSEAADYYYFVYINPYNGKVLKVKDEFNDFFRFVLDGHYYLWLPHELGHTVVATATLIFFAMVLSGLFLWWPRNKAGRRQRFSIRWDARWRRRNYDLHNVVGFYVLFIALVFAITGLVWGFQWFSKGYFAIISGGAEMKQYQQPVSNNRFQDNLSKPAIDAVWLHLKDVVPANGSIEVHTPETDSSSIAVNINPDPSTYWQTDYRYFDQYTLQELSVDHIWGRYNVANTSYKIMRMNYDIHVGAVWGLPGKVLAFCASLVIASLPVTGTLIWWGRRKRGR